MEQFEVLNMNLVKGPGACKALVDIVFDDMVALYGCKVMVGADGKMFLAMPSFKRGDEYKDACKIIDKDTMTNVTVAVFAKYNAKLKSQQAKTDHPPEGGA